jgi:hypothetical protein
MGIGMYVSMGTDHAFFGQRFKSPAILQEELVLLEEQLME